ncbi:MAG: MDR family MFS transporter [Vicinamibacterales bacterium]
MDTGAASSQPQFSTSGIVRLTKPQLAGTLTGLLLAMLLAALDQTIVGTAEPRIIAQLSGFDRYPWVATAYMLTSTVSVPIFASLSDTFGRKRFFTLGAALFVLTSALCGAAGLVTFLPIDGMNQLILFRGLQGIGAGMVMGLAFTIIGDIFSPAERGRYQGLFAAVWGLSSIFGPTLGGWLTDSVSWRACFLVNLPVGVVAVTAIWLELPDFRPARSGRRLDWAGFATLIGCVVPLLLALTWATGDGWGSTRVTSLLGLSAAMALAFIYAETRAPEPLLPLTLFRHPVIAICSICVFVLGMGMFGVIIYLPLFMQGVLGVTPTQSGNLLTPMMIGAVCGSIASGQLIARTGRYKGAAIAGSIMVAAAMIGFANMQEDTSLQYLVATMIVAGLGMGLLQPVYTVAVQNVAPREQMGAATASTVFFRSIGSTVGVAVFGTLMLGRYARVFSARLPEGVPADALPFFSNPLMLAEARPNVEAILSRTADAPGLAQALFSNVRVALTAGLHGIFVWSAAIMGASVLLHLALRGEPLKSRHVDAESAMP